MFFPPSKIKIELLFQILSISDGNEDPKSRSGTPDEIPIVPAGSSAEDNICPICHEEFDQFYKQDFADISSSEGEVF